METEVGEVRVAKAEGRGKKEERRKETRRERGKEKSKGKRMEVQQIVEK